MLYELLGTNRNAAGSLLQIDGGWCGSAPRVPVRLHTVLQETKNPALSVIAGPRASVGARRKMIHSASPNRGAFKDLLTLESWTDRLLRRSRPQPRRPGRAEQIETDDERTLGTIWSVPWLSPDPRRRCLTNFGSRRPPAHSTARADDSSPGRRAPAPVGSPVTRRR
jgi:hypothetical protein